MPKSASDRASRMSHPFDRPPSLATGASFVPSLAGSQAQMDSSKGLAALRGAIDWISNTPNGFVRLETTHTTSAKSASHWYTNVMVRKNAPFSIT